MVGGEEWKEEGEEKEVKKEERESSKKVVVGEKEGEEKEVKGNKEKGERTVKKVMGGWRMEGRRRGERSQERREREQ